RRLLTRFQHGLSAASAQGAQYAAGIGAEGSGAGAAVSQKYVEAIPVAVAHAALGRQGGSASVCRAGTVGGLPRCRVFLDASRAGRVYCVVAGVIGAAIQAVQWRPLRRQARRNGRAAEERRRLFHEERNNE